ISQGFNPLKELARTTGKSMSQLKEEMSKGLISARDIAGAIDSATGEGGKFYKMNERIAQTYDGKLSTAQGNIGALLREFGQQILPYVNALLDKFNAHWEKLIPYIQKTGGAIKSFVNNIGNVMTVLTP